MLGVAAEREPVVRECVLVALLAQADVAEVVRRDGRLRVELDRALEQRPRLLELVELRQQEAVVAERRPVRRVELDRRLELAARLLDTALDHQPERRVVALLRGHFGSSSLINSFGLISGTMNSIWSSESWNGWPKTYLNGMRTPIFSAEPASNFASSHSFL